MQQRAQLRHCRVRRHVRRRHVPQRRRRRRASGGGRRGGAGRGRRREVAHTSQKCPWRPTARPAAAPTGVAYLANAAHHPSSRAARNRTARRDASSETPRRAKPGPAHPPRCPRPRLRSTPQAARSERRPAPPRARAPPRGTAGAPAPAASRVLSRRPRAALGPPQPVPACLPTGHCQWHRRAAAKWRPLGAARRPRRHCTPTTATPPAHRRRPRVLLPL